MHAGPAVVGESRLQPRVRLAAGVDRLAVVEVVEDDSGWASSPALIGDNGLGQLSANSISSCARAASSLP